MSFDSYCWKQLLKKDIKYLDKNLLLNNKHTEYLLSNIEIKLFIIVFSLRKLFDSKKISDKLSNYKIEVKCFERKINKNVTKMNNHCLEDIYNIKKGNKTKLYIREICNKIIHSYTFQLVVYGKKIRYVYFNSDYNKDKYLYYIRIKDLINFVSKVLRENPSKIQFIYKDKLKDYDILVSN